MKYFIYSLAFHLFCLGGLIFSWGSKTNSSISFTEEQLFVEVVSSQQQSTANKKNKKVQIKKKSLVADRNLPLKKLDKKKTIEEENSPSSNLTATTLTYAQELKFYLEKNKYYPRQAIRLKQSGVVLVKVKISPSGKFEDIKVAKPSLFPILNQAAVDLLKKLGNFKPLPKEVKEGSLFTIPIAYIMGGEK